MKLKELFENSVKKLDGIENGEIDLKQIFKKVLSVIETDFILNNEIELSGKQEEEINSMIASRLEGIPIQYIIGEWDFYGSTFKVSKDVLIPRPETEILCEYVLDYIKDIDTPYVADLCSGSGCIGITIKKHKADAYVNLVEKSKQAAQCISENARNLLKNEFIAITVGDIFYPEIFKTMPLFDVIVSNPPYIKSSEIPSLQKEVQFEPKMALDGGEDGLDFYRLIINKWIDFLKDDGMFAFECGEGQATDIKAMLEKQNCDAEIIKDYSDIDRIVIGKRRKI